MKKPDWDSYFMAMTFMVAVRSIDTSTKCGCVVVSADNTVLSVGYNGPPTGCNDELVPMTRPEKYAYMTHAEENAICLAAKEGVCLKGATFYITGYPCSRCFRSMKNVGASRIVYGPNMAAMHTRDDSKDKGDFKVIEFMNSDNAIEFVEYRGELLSIFEQAKSIYGNTLFENSKKRHLAKEGE